MMQAAESGKGLNRVRMNFEFLAPGMQHTEEANLCAEVSGREKEIHTASRTLTRPLPRRRST
jgi:hypothetical protein